MIKLVRRVATQQALRVAETKRFAVLNENWTPTPSNSAKSQWYYKSVFAPLDLGIGSYQMIGSEIQRPLLKFKYKIDVPWQAILTDVRNNYGGVAVTVALVAANDAFAFTGVNQYSLISPTQNWFYSDDVRQPTFNGNNVKVLKMKRHVFRPGQVASATVVSGSGFGRGSLTYRWKRKLTFEDTGVPPASGGPASSRTLRGWNYYLMVGYGMPGPLNSVLNNGFPYVYGDTFLYYKDP